MSDLVFIDCGVIDGVRYVDVVDDGGNPLVCVVSIEDAIESYGERVLLTMAQFAESA